MALTIIECIRVGRHIRLEAHAANRIHPGSDGVTAAAPAPAHHDQYPAAPPPLDGANAPPAADPTSLVRHSYTMPHDVAQMNIQVTGSRTSRNIVELGMLIMFARQSLADIRPGSRSRAAATLVRIILLLLLPPPTSGGRRITIAFTLPARPLAAIPRNTASPILVVVFLWGDAPPGDAAALSPATASGGGGDAATAAAIGALALSLGLLSELGSSGATMSFDVDDVVGVILVVAIVAAAASDPAPSPPTMSAPSNDDDEYDEYDDDDDDPRVDDDSYADEGGVGGVEGESAAASSSPSHTFRPDTIHSLHLLAFAAALSSSSLRASLPTSSL
jgi:hypothetical protein